MYGYLINTVIAFAISWAIAFIASQGTLAQADAYKVVYAIQTKQVVK